VGGMIQEGWTHLESLVPPRSLPSGGWQGAATATAAAADTRRGRRSKLEAGAEGVCHAAELKGEGADGRCEVSPQLCRRERGQRAGPGIVLLLRKEPNQPSRGARSRKTAASRHPCT